MILASVARYPYLLGSLALFAVFLAGFLIFKDQRKPMFLSGLLSAPFSFASIMFVPEYWTPVRVVEFGTGIEDLLFSFATGGIVWLLAVWPFRRKLSVDLDARRILAGYMLITAAGLTATGLSWRQGLSPMGATLVSVLALGVGLCLVRTGHLPILLAGTVTFTGLYWVWITLLSLLAPSFLSHFRDENLWGVRLFLGIPLEEMAWAVGFGGVWPLFMAFVFNTRLDGRPPAAATTDNCRRVSV